MGSSERAAARHRQQINDGGDIMSEKSGRHYKPKPLIRQAARLQSANLSQLIKYLILLTIQILRLQSIS